MSANDQTFRDREARRRERIASAWRPDPKVERMRRLLDEDPTEFDRTFGGVGRIMVGLYESGRTAADDDPGPAAA